jgi:hypothetical protein
MATSIGWPRPCRRAREVVGTEVSVYQVPELVPDDILEKTGAKAARTAFAHVPVAKPEKLADADAIIFGTPTRFGNMCAQMRNFLENGRELPFAISIGECPQHSEPQRVDPGGASCDSAGRRLV